MKTPLQVGQVLPSGFEVLAVEELKEINGVGIWARHRTGAEVFHILNDDSENLFAFGFATAPENDAGAAHILEHSVLCGSENYPLKDPFIILAQGSLQTFLNAMTFPDKTLYPASSTNERDYFNLMSVYGDAVFRPLLPEWVFMQEGRRLTLESEPDAEPQLKLTGVVYNEMKGAYSSRDAYAAFWSCRGILPDTPYAFESGGDPEHIPQLTWEELRKFHRERYTPANCRIFLAGNIPTEKQFDFLDGTILQGLPAGSRAAPIPDAAPWAEPQFVAVPCPAGGDPKSTVAISWLCSDSRDAVESVALAALTETLLGHDGAPLIRPLIESGLGEDLAPVTGFEGDLRQSIFTLGLRGVPGKGEENARKIEAFILEEFARLVREGIPKEEIEAALLGLEFSHREIRRAGGPYSLVWMQRAFRGWLHGAKPWETLLFQPGFSVLKEELQRNEKYFESLIEKYILNNPHRLLISLEGEEDFLEKKEAALEAELEKRRLSLGSDELERIVRSSAELEEIQQKEDSPEALATIPHLSREDLSGTIETVPRAILDAGGIPLFTHELFTNGISYVNVTIPVDILENEDYPWLPLYCRSAVSMGLPGMDYGEVSSLLARTAGDVHASLRTSPMAPGMANTLPVPTGILDLGGRDWLNYSIKALDEKTPAALDILKRLILEADFSDLRRLKDLVLELKNDADSSFAHSGMSFATGLAGRHFSRSRMTEELWSGVSQLSFIHAMVERDIEEISARLTGLRDRLREGGILVNITGSALSAAESYLASSWKSFGPPRPRNPTLDIAAFEHTPKFTGQPEVYGSPSFQIGFAAMTFPGAPYNAWELGAEAVLAHQLSTGLLWEDIRMRGGAYGAFASSDGLEGSFNFATYRDPNPLRSLDAFIRILQERGAKAGDGDALDKAVIGTYGKEIRPRTSAEQGGSDFLRYLYGIDQRHRERRLQALLRVREEDMLQAANRLAAAAKGELKEAAVPGRVIIAGISAAREAAAKLGVECRELPL